MQIEFLDGDGGWHPIDGATCAAVFPNSYEIEFPLATLWAGSKRVFEAMTFRVDGRISLKAYVQAASSHGNLTMMLLV